MGRETVHKQVHMFLLGLVILSLLTSPVLGFGQLQISEAEAALNVKEFDPASAFGLSFSDSISPYSGALTFTQTDLVLPGRNGLDVRIVRQYNSNVFAHINQMYGTPTDACYANSLCDDCTPGSTIQGQAYDTSTGTAGQWYSIPTTTCTTTDQELTTFKRAKQIGRGWDMTFGRVKTPAPILFKPVPRGDIGDLMPTYEFVSNRGVTSDSLVLFNNEIPLIWPSMFRKHIDLYDADDGSFSLDDYPFWNIAQSFNEGVYEKTQSAIVEDGECIQPAMYIRHDLLPGVSDMVSHHSNEGYSFIKDPWCSMGKDSYSPGYGKYTLYTSDLSPVHFNFHTAQNDALPGGNYDYYLAPAGIHIDYCELLDPWFGGEFVDPLRCLAHNNGMMGPEVKYTSRDGIIYSFENFVPFCDEYDDLDDEKDNYEDVVYTSQGTADNYPGTTYGCGWTETDYLHAQDSTKWAENPYPGTYLTQMKDSFGNTIDYYYVADESGEVEGKTTGSPFVAKIVDTYGNEIRFQYYKPNGVWDKDVRLIRIAYPSPTNPSQTLYTHYMYEDTMADNGCTTAEEKPLLRHVYKSADSAPGVCEPVNAIKGTATEYAYDPDSQELVQVTLPTGAVINYRYVWFMDSGQNGNMPSYDLTEINLDPVYQSVARRGVHEKSIKNGGTCERTNAEGECLWTYDYDVIGTSQGDIPCYEGQLGDGLDEHGEEVAPTCLLFTTTDPFHVKVKEKLLPATIQSTWRDQSGSTVLEAIAGSGCTAGAAAAAPSPSESTTITEAVDTESAERVEKEVVQYPEVLTRTEEESPCPKTDLQYPYCETP